jgi:hypothetical protein
MSSSFGLSPGTAASWKCWVCSRRTGSDQTAFRNIDGSFYCFSRKHRENVASFLTSGSTQDDQALAAAQLFDDRISALVFDADKAQVQSLLYLYLRSKGAITLALAKLDRFEHTDRIVLSMLAAWKYLAMSRAGEDPVGAGSIKNVRMAWETWLERRDDWKLHKQQVFDAGQVHLVGKLVRPFLEIVDTVKLLTA